METSREDFQTEFASRQAHYRHILTGPLKGPAMELMRLLGERSYKAIVVYPVAVMWEPQQRPQHIMKELAKRGYICFFCEYMHAGFRVSEIEPNLFVVHGEAYLLAALRSQSAIVLCTWMMQMAWAELLPHKTVWFDILDSPNLFSYYDSGMVDKQRQVLGMADIVTYSSQNLQKYAAARADAVYLPNAAHADHFQNAPPRPPSDLKKIVASGSPIVGYFGAIESWLDIDLIEEVARRRPEWQFVFVGKNGLPPDRLAAPNIHLLGAKSYKQIPRYAHCFHVAIIPFAVNEITDCVSPVKFYEYAAAGLPVVSTPIAEMKPFRSDWVRIADGPDDFASAIRRCLKPETAGIAKEAGPAFAAGQQWSSRADAIERLLTVRPNSWNGYANYDPGGSVAIMATTFFDFDGEQFYSGGAERYLVDLSRLCRRAGLRPVIYQYGHYAWMRRFQHFDVVSLSRGGQHARLFSVANVRMFNRLFREQTEGRSALSIYSAYFNAWPRGAGGPGIGIIHGVCWDHPEARFEEGTRFWEQNRRFIEGAHQCQELVSVDTNSANWFQTVDYELGQRIKVIPNYVDEAEFSPRPGYDRSGARIVILYPRRLYKPRGLYMALEVADRILERYPQVDFHFVGNGDEADTVHVKEKIRKWGERIRLYALPMHEMAQAYRSADISLIPTLYSEGTSLSCLEAMACGNAVVATRIGGLSDLVIHDYNGLLIEPNADALHRAIRDLLDNPAKLSSLKRRAAEVAAVFSKRRWERSWLDVLRGKLPASGSGTAEGAGEPSGRLVDVYLPDMPQAGGKLGRVIVKLLSRGDLIYLRIKGGARFHMRSFGRLQWSDWESHRFAEPDAIIADQSVVAEISRPVDAILNGEGELEWISSSRP